MPRTLSTDSRRWLAGAAVEQIESGPLSQSKDGAAALAQLLEGTPAEEASHALLTHLTLAAQDAAEITRALDAAPPADFP